jgi:D-alanyl-D-alanine carboxypeptidase/D-alanyl-D-alanine-endopeptidase (penicillin-binding protein 4)
MLKCKNIKLILFRCLASPDTIGRTMVRFLFLIPYFLFTSCSISKQISKQATEILLKDSSISTGHIGICIYEPATNKYWYNYQAEKYFIPASNTKLFTFYAGSKYLGDSLVGLKVTEYNNEIIVFPSGDPTLLHEDFKNQPVYNFLKQPTNKTIWIGSGAWQENALGYGWSWDDYNSSDMVQRSSLPVFGNLIHFSGTKNNIKYFPQKAILNNAFSIYSKNGAIGFIDKVTRDFKQNNFVLNIDGKELKQIKIPFITSEILNAELLIDSLHSANTIMPPGFAPPVLSNENINILPKKYVIHSQPTDSFFKIMMHRSDNFFAEQTLLMASNEKLGVMSDEKMIDYVLQNDLKDIPQKAKWVDGSGLSRYNLFTPKDFVYILQKLKNEFGFERLKVILPTGGTGTLSSLYKKDSGYIFAKTGTLSNNAALSGFLITRSNRLLLFSILTNNFIGSAAPIRKAVEKFLSGIRQRY